MYDGISALDGKSFPLRSPPLFPLIRYTNTLFTGASMTDFFKKTHASPAPSFSLPPALPPGCRGIFYRIFLSRTIGAEGLGIFNMVHPVYGICFALRAGSIQTAISRFVAADVQKEKQIFRTGLVISLTLSIALAAFIRQQVSFLLILSYISLS